MVRTCEPGDAEVWRSLGDLSEVGLDARLRSRRAIRWDLTSFTLVLRAGAPLRLMAVTAGEVVNARLVRPISVDFGADEFALQMGARPLVVVRRMVWNVDGRIDLDLGEGRVSRWLARWGGELLTSRARAFHQQHPALAGVFGGRG